MSNIVQLQDAGANSILQDIARARENIQKSLAGVSRLYFNTFNNSQGFCFAHTTRPRSVWMLLGLLGGLRYSQAINCRQNHTVVVFQPTPLS